MSAEAMGFVYRYSPFKGATFAVHLAAADSVNDMNHYDFWMSQGSVAGKARVSRQSANEAIEELTQAGFFELLKQDKGKVNRYRFLFPECPPVYNPRHLSTEPTTYLSKQATGDVKPDDTHLSTEPTQNPRSNPKEPNARAKKKPTNLKAWEKQPCPHMVLHCNRVSAFCDWCARERRDLVA